MTYYAQILLADDDEDDRFFFEEALEDLGISAKVNTFEDGTYLMEYLRANTLDVPNIVFLDLNMPLKSGRDCLKEIKTDPALKDTIVAIYSTSSAKNDIDTTFLDGAAIYIKKPSSFSDLKDILQQVISKAWNQSNLDNYVFSA